MFLPAMGVHAGFYDALGNALHAAGFHVVIGDWRHHGAGSVKPSRNVDYGYKELVREDCAQLVAFTKRLFPESMLLIGGHSSGGHVTALYSTFAPPGQVAGVFGVAAGAVYFRGWRGVEALRILALSQAAATIATVVGYFPGKQVGFAGLEPKTQMRDWARNARGGKFQLTGDDYDYERALREVTLPVFAISISDDEFAPPGAAAKLYGKFEGAKLRYESIAPQRFGRPRVGHFSWAKTPDPVVESLKNWAREIGA
jgi:predicted alpha/beta hydrolase